MNEQSSLEAGHEKVVTVDVREDIRTGKEPFSKIMTAVAGLAADDRLRLLAPFEPAPLFNVMAKKGFGHAARPIGNGDWEVLFTRQSAAGVPNTTPPAPTSPARNQTAATPADILEVDARGLEPPQPMVTILEAVAGLPEGKILHARTDRRPMHLYPQLEERGFTAKTLEQTDGSFLTHIWRH